MRYLSIRRPARRGFLSSKILAAGAVVVAAGVAWWFLGPATGSLADQRSTLPTFTVLQGDLIIDAVEPGNIEAGDAQVIRSQVEGRTTIIDIVPEGTIITPQDVEEQRILLRLDASSLEDRLIQQEITLEGAKASYAEASTGLDIQINENESLEREAELSVLFARMDLQRYLGADVAERFTSSTLRLHELIDQPDLGGEAMQLLRTLQSDIDLTREETARTSATLSWTIKLEEKGYVTRDQLVSDELALKIRQVAESKAEVALEQFRRYDFAKQAEQLRSDYIKAVSEMERTLAKNSARLAQAEARLAQAEATLRQQNDVVERLRTQIANSVVFATQPGMVVYNNTQFRDDRRIEEGAEVFERQEIIQIPNTATMVVRTGVHESIIARVREGLRAEIAVDAIPDRKFRGVVSRVGILPDATNRWMNPNLKVYATFVTIENADTGLFKPGMTAQVRIILDELHNVVMAPIQAVTAEGDVKYCTVLTPSGEQKREVVLGDYDDRFVQIKSGLEPGEVVLLRRSITLSDPGARGRRDQEEDTDGVPRRPPGPDGPGAPGGERPAGGDAMPARPVAQDEGSAPVAADASTVTIAEGGQS